MDPVIESPLGPPIDTEEQARGWIIQLVDRLERERRQIDMIPMANERRRGFDRYRMLYGQALGTLVALQRCRKLGDVAYNELRQRILNSAMPSVVVFDGEG